MKATCSLSGETFEVTDLEMELREKFGVGGTLPDRKPKYRFQQLGAFWSYWYLHKRICDKTKKPIVSVFRPDCPYPVWHKDEWMKHADPPMSEFDETKEFFPQVWELFQTCPIPHTSGNYNQNCEYTSDWWQSKDCYLCSSGYLCEDLRYCYRTHTLKDSQFCVFSFYSELCYDLVNSFHCFETIHSINCHRVQNSAFLYDCRNCKNCMFCFNLRNKEFCFGNQQLTKEEYEEKKSEWDLSSRKMYDKAKKHFSEMMKDMAWHRAQSIDKCEDSTGNYIENCNESKNCFYIEDTDECVNAIRGAVEIKSCLDTIDCCYFAELNYMSVNSLDHTYMNRFCDNTPKSKFLDYCMYCFQCEHCFGCCGLVGKKYCILNKQYSEEEYKKKKEEIITSMKKTGEWGQFWPGSFAACPYEESCSGFHMPLSKKDQKEQGFQCFDSIERKSESVLKVKDVPDKVTDNVEDQVFWDNEFNRPFSIPKADIDFCKKLKVPLPNSYYIKRIQENFSWIPFDGELRKCSCGKSRIDIETSWPKQYDGRILCEKEYQGILS